jgi:hypothetical protein
VHEEPIGQDLEKLKDEITQYYQTYYAELRSHPANNDPAIFGSIPQHLKGYRRVVTELGRDGIVVTHWPAGQDSFDFHISPDRAAKDLAAEQCGGEQVIDYPPGSDFGSYEFAEPLKLVVDGRVVWTAPWTRMEISSSLDAWRDAEAARTVAEEDLRPYIEDGPS